MTPQTKQNLILYGVPTLVGVTTIALLLRRTQSALEAQGAALRQRVETTIRQDVEAQVQPALDSIGITQEVKDRIDRIGQNFSAGRGVVA